MFGSKERGPIISIGNIIINECGHEEEHHHHKKNKLKHLTANYYTVSKSGDIIFNKSNNNQMGQTIQVGASQNSVPGQLIGLAADGVTQEPLSGLQPGSEVYTTSDATIATISPVSGGAEGQYTVDRVAGASGSVQVGYSATLADGTTIVNGPAGGDTIVFAGQPTGVISSLSSIYGAPQTKKK